MSRAHDPQGLVEAYGGVESLAERLGQYNWAITTLVLLGLSEGDTIVDVGAGMCDLDYVLRRRGWSGRYVPVDGDIDPGIDLENWNPFPADFYVCLDVVEHLYDWRGLIARMQKVSRKGLVLTTADAATIDVLGMHPSHVSEVRIQDLRALGLVTDSQSLGEYHQLYGLWKQGWESP